MHTLSLITIAVLGTMYGLTWHDQPAQAESSIADDDSTSRKLEPATWRMVVIRSFIFLSFAALVLAGCIIWIKCHGDYSH